LLFLHLPLYYHVTSGNRLRTYKDFARTKELLQHFPLEKSNVLGSHISVVAVGQLFGTCLAFVIITEFLKVFTRTVNMALDRTEIIGEFSGLEILYHPRQNFRPILTQCQVESSDYLRAG
jgi:hypothetical protein